jgi:hypothetical protein
MNPKMHQYDPWGPISSTLYTINDSDLVENLIGFTGMVLNLSSSRTSTLAGGLKKFPADGCGKSL